MAKLTKEQEQAVANWAAEGASLNDIQVRLKSEFDVTVTYLDARLLVMELGVKLQERKRETPPEPREEAAPQAPEDGAPEDLDEPEVLPPPGSAGGGNVTVSIDQLTIPGAMVSGKATFSDGETASWYLDQTGRLGLRASNPEYRPPPADIPVFQRELDLALQKAGF